MPPGTIPATGYGHAFGNLFNSSAPDKGIGVNLNIPLRNRQNQADQVRSVIEYRQAQMSAQQQENTITLQVRNAQFTLQQNYAALQSAVAARDYASQNLDAEQKKYSLGASTSTLVLQASSALTQAESNVLAAATNYEKSRVQLDLFTADTLAKMGIDMSEAESGKVQKMPKVPGAIPVTDQAPPPPQPNAANQAQSANLPPHAVLRGGMLFCSCRLARAVSMECLEPLGRHHHAERGSQPGAHARKRRLGRRDHRRSIPARPTARARLRSRFTRSSSSNRGRASRPEEFRAGESDGRLDSLARRRRRSRTGAG